MTGRCSARTLQLLRAAQLQGRSTESLARSFYTTRRPARCFESLKAAGSWARTGAWRRSRYSRRDISERSYRHRKPIQANSASSTWSVCGPAFNRPSSYRLTPRFVTIDDSGPQWLPRLREEGAGDVTAICIRLQRPSTGATAAGRSQWPWADIAKRGYSSLRPSLAIWAPIGGRIPIRNCPLDGNWRIRGLAREPNVLHSGTMLPQVLSTKALSTLSRFAESSLRIRNRHRISNSFGIARPLPQNSERASYAEPNTK